MFEPLISALFPHRCPSCGRTCEGTDFCALCMEWVEADGAWVTHRAVQTLSAFTYEGSMRDALVRFKNGGHVESGLAIARLCRSVWQLPEDWCPDLVVPVGSNSRRIRRRGFNPAAVIAGVAAKRLAVRMRPDVVQRSLDFAGQKGQGATARHLAVAGAFGVVRPEQVLDRDILLVDDVVTTGATVAECGRILVEAGARSVVAWTAARVR